MKWLVLSCLGLGVLGTGVLAWIVTTRQGTPPTERTPRELTEAQRGRTQRVEEAAPPDTRRLFLENHKMDDGPRRVIFGRFIRKAGERCDDITAALMRSAGTWRVACAPGYVYVFRFDSRGELVGAVKE